MADYYLYEMEVKNVVVGTGAAGYNAALQLFRLGEKETILVSENKNSGTSRNTGSDKQTYYKLSLSGADNDSVRKMAEDLFSGECVDGDLALCEAALSARGFYNLVELGVAFPSNEYGEYMGYKTDHDRGRRATSAGPYTSKMMTERLENEVQKKQVPVYDHLQVIRLLVEENRIRGLLCLDTKKSDSLYFQIIWCSNVVYATGGPAGIYHDSVYPDSQIGSSGLAFEAGVKGKNLTEWQFGIASISPRWNVSGTYMQVLPRFISADISGGDEREFLLDYFDDTYEMLNNVFLKGYQWPFDTSKVFGGSSVIDLLVYQECVLKKRRVFLDFQNNPGQDAIDYTQISVEAYEYLKQAGACFGTPIDRLKQMNQPAVDFYKEHGVDLSADLLEIAICAQHNNGGLSTDSRWETDIKGLFAVGEVCGSHGVSRPGGSALNAGQVGGYRAAEAIAFPQESKNQSEFNKENCLAQAKERIKLFFSLTGNKSISSCWTEASTRMSYYGGMIRNVDGIGKALMSTEELLGSLPASVFGKPKDAGMFFHLYDLLIAQMVYLSAMKNHLEHGAKSRGSGLYTDYGGRKASAKLPNLFSCVLDEGEHGNVVQEVQLKDGKCHFFWRPVRELPRADDFFENQWRMFRRRRGL